MFNCGHILILDSRNLYLTVLLNQNGFRDQELWSYNMKHMLLNIMEKAKMFRAEKRGISWRHKVKLQFWLKDEINWGLPFNLYILKFNNFISNYLIIWLCLPLQRILKAFPPLFNVLSYVKNILLPTSTITLFLSTLNLPLPTSSRLQTHHSGCQIHSSRAKTHHSVCQTRSSRA